MHLLAEQTTEIACPVDVVYKYTSNLERFGEWFPGVIAIEAANDLEHGAIGKQYLETVSVPMRESRKVSITVKDAEINRFFATEGTFHPLMPRMEILFQPTGPSSCQITWRMFSRNKGFVSRFTIIPLARIVLRKRAAIGSAMLKKLLEGR